jgi:hypothetical protein
MKPIVVLGMAQPYPGYGCEQVTIVASRIPDTIVAFGQTQVDTACEEKKGRTGTETQKNVLANGSLFGPICI